MRERERKFERDTFWSWIGQHLDLFTSSPSIAWWPKTGLCRNFCQFQSNFNFLTFNNTLKYFSQPKKASYKCKPFTDSFKCKKLRASLSAFSAYSIKQSCSFCYSATHLLSPPSPQKRQFPFLLLPCLHLLVFHHLGLPYSSGFYF